MRVIMGQARQTKLRARRHVILCGLDRPVMARLSNTMWSVYAARLYFTSYVLKLPLIQLRRKTKNAGEIVTYSWI